MILVSSLEIVDLSDLNSLLMYFSFIISCLCLNRYLSFERFFPFVTQLLFAYFLKCLTTVLFHLPFDIFCKSTWAVGILHFLISPVTWFSKLFLFWPNSISYIFAISFLWSFSFSNVHEYINWRLSRSKISGNIPVSNIDPNYWSWYW